MHVMTGKSRRKTKTKTIKCDVNDITVYFGGSMTCQLNMKGNPSANTRHFPIRKKHEFKNGVYKTRKNNEMFCFCS